MRDRKFQIRLDEDTAVALRRLADAEERSMAAQLRLMIKHEAAKKGFWVPRQPRVVRSAAE